MGRSLPPPLSVVWTPSVVIRTPLSSLPYKRLLRAVFAGSVLRCNFAASASSGQVKAMLSLAVNGGQRQPPLSHSTEIDSSTSSSSKGSVRLRNPFDDSQQAHNSTQAPNYHHHHHHHHHQQHHQYHGQQHQRSNYYKGSSTGSFEGAPTLMLWIPTLSFVTKDSPAHDTSSLPYACPSISPGENPIFIHLVVVILSDIWAPLCRRFFDVSTYFAVVTVFICQGITRENTMFLMRRGGHPFIIMNHVEYSVK